MKLSDFLTSSAKYLLLTCMGLTVLIMGTKTEATSIVINNIKKYDGVSCDKLMSVYKRAYISVGFKFSNMEMFTPDILLMSFTFPNPAEPKKPPGGGAIKFYLSETKELSCEVSIYELGVLGHYGEYTLAEHVAFGKAIDAASNQAQSLITKRVGAPKSVRK